MSKINDDWYAAITFNRDDTFGRPSRKYRGGLFHDRCMAGNGTRRPTKGLRNFLRRLFLNSGGIPSYHRRLFNVVFAAVLALGIIRDRIDLASHRIDRNALRSIGRHQFDFKNGISLFVVECGVDRLATNGLFGRADGVRKVKFRAIQLGKFGGIIRPVLVFSSHRGRKDGQWREGTYGDDGSHCRDEGFVSGHDLLQSGEPEWCTWREYERPSLRRSRPELTLR
ncbi:hypothetical protein AGR5A_Lc50268 [Agrobacterium genomosp. 5 str. CFBP 6626]|nr:hypothetical protein AGR5A_Lc50268 [Agrobacterium genomosp. 5 str. CFBP 6626]